MRLRPLPSLLLALLLASPASSARPPAKATPEAAAAFVAKADVELRRLWVAQSKADWAKQTNITPETEAAAAAAGSAAMTWITKAIKDARRFAPLIGTGKLAPEVERQLVLLRVAGQPAPDDARKTKALAEVMAGMATILQFQFHRALCKARGHTGPLHTCSIYGSLEAGKPLREMLRLGASRPWQDALSVVARANAPWIRARSSRTSRR